MGFGGVRTGGNNIIYVYRRRNARQNSKTRGSVVHNRVCECLYVFQIDFEGGKVVFGTYLVMFCG